MKAITAIRQGNHYQRNKTVPHSPANHSPDYSVPDPELAMQEVPDWSAQLVLAAFALVAAALRYSPTILLGAFYAAVTSATAIIIIHHFTH